MSQSTTLCPFGDCPCPGAVGTAKRVMEAAYRARQGDSSLSCVTYFYIMCLPFSSFPTTMSHNPFPSASLWNLPGLGEDGEFRHECCFKLVCAKSPYTHAASAAPPPRQPRPPRNLEFDKNGAYRCRANPEYRS